MTTGMRTEERVHEAIEGGPSAGFLERLAERIGAQARVQAVFGEPIERGELTVVPVARVRWGFGGGAGQAGEGPEVSGASAGSGGGGGAAADPVGYLEIGPGGATFRPIREPLASPGLVLAFALAAAILLRAAARLVRR